MRYNIPHPLFIKSGDLYSGVGIVPLGREDPDFEYPSDLKQIYILLDPGHIVALLLPVERTRAIRPHLFRFC